MSHRTALPFLWLLVLASLFVPLRAAEKLPDAPRPKATAGTPDASARQRDIERYRKLVTDLAAPEMEGRGPGTKGLEIARDYLVNELKALGLKPAFISKNPGEPTYLQTFDINAGAVAKSLDLVVLDTNGKELMKPKAVEHYNARGFSGNARFEGPAVFVGYAAKSKEQSYDSFAGLDKEALKGKVAIAFRYEPMDEKGKAKWAGEAPGGWGDLSNLISKAKWAAEHGASALVVVDPPRPNADGPIPTVAGTQAGEMTPIPVIQMTQEVFRAMLRGANLGDVTTPGKWQSAADAGELKPTPMEGIVVKGHVELERKKVAVENVAGVLPGTGELANEYIVIGAHYDHLGHGGMGAIGKSKPGDIYHGADDNASGTAGIVLIAQRFVELAKADADSPAAGGAASSGPALGANLDTNANKPPAQPKPRRSILFVLFNGEERGLLGSAHMMRSLADLNIKQEQIVAMLNLDMIGRMKDDKVVGVGVGSGDKFEPWVKEAETLAGIKISTSGGDGIGGSDHQSFHTRGIPAIHFFTGVHPDYHKPSDTAEKINVEGGVKVCEATIAIARKMWHSSDKIAFQKVRMAHPAAGGPRGGGAYLGIVPNYASLDADTGCAIDGTSPGSPAEAAGMKTDDVITAWDDKPVKNLKDLTGLIGAAKPGQEVKVKVKRGDKEVELKVKLGTR